MGYRLLVDLVVSVHLAFLAYVVLGGFLAWRWPRLIWLHLPVAAYGGLIVLIGWTCPLTAVERWLRTRAGEHGYRDGFIDHYLTGVLYPEHFKTQARLLAALVVAVSYAGVLLIAQRPPVGNDAADTTWSRRVTR
ncbi:MAG: hypothetical protein QOD45_1617 [Pseudonocardiales bacterium]|jgi:uncharacterized membrane protein YhhN|nr:hypothetical protein [Pseudonocardiales bacterium]